MSCIGAYATVREFEDYFCVSVDPGEEASMNNILRLSSGRIHAARQASAQCDCDLSDWATDHLKELNIWIAAAVYACPCAMLHLSDDTRRQLLDEVRDALKLIRTGEIELCAGETGMDYPAAESVERAWSSNIGQIIANDLKRDL